jgi:protein-arginine kinase activator protein McsA
MRAAADRLDFEAAAAHRDRIRYLETKGVLA